MVNDVVCMLSMDSVDIDFMDTNSGPPMLEAAYCQRWDICRLLFDAGARLDIIHPQQGSILRWLFVPCLDDDINLQLKPGNKNLIVDVVRAGARIDYGMQPEIELEINKIIKILNAELIDVKNSICIWSKLGYNLAHLICKFLYSDLLVTADYE